MFFFILNTCLLDIVLILQGEILSWSLMGVKGSKGLTVLVVNTASICPNNYLIVPSSTGVPPQLYAQRFVTGQ